MALNTKIGQTFDLNIRDFQENPHAKARRRRGRRPQLAAPVSFCSPTERFRLPTEHCKKSRFGSLNTSSLLPIPYCNIFELAGLLYYAHFTEDISSILYFQ